MQKYLKILPFPPPDFVLQVPENGRLQGPQRGLGPDPKHMPGPGGIVLGPWMGELYFFEKLFATLLP